MDLKLEILSTVSIKRKKPWPRLAWLLEREPPLSLYLLDGSRISQLSLRTGKTRKKFPSIVQVQSQLALTSTSPGGSFLGGLTTDGDFFLWNKATDVLETFVSPLSRLGGEKDKPNVQQFKDYGLFLSESGEQALLVANKNEIYLWDMGEDGRTSWWKLIPPDDVEMPEASTREAVVDTCFYVHPVLGECCSCVFVFTSREPPGHVTTITQLIINWPNSTVQFYSNHTRQPETAQHAFPFGSHSVNRDQNKPITPPSSDVRHQENLSSTSHVSSKDSSTPQIEEQKGQSPNRHRLNNEYAPPLRDRTNLSSNGRDTIHAKPIIGQNRTHFSALLDGPPPFQASWTTLSHSPPSEDRVSSSTHTGRGSYVCKICPSGCVVALCVNEREACDTHMMFFSPLVSVGVTSPVYPLRENSNRRGRTYWVTDMTWSSDELFLVCVTRRGCLLILPRFGPPLKLVTVGSSSLELRPTTLLPLHPLITVTGVSKAITDHETSQSSERDPLRQRFSVSTHPHLPLFLCSDGYSLTILKFSPEPSSSLCHLVRGLVLDARDKLGLPFSDVQVTGELSGESGIKDGGAMSSEMYLDQLAATFGGSELGSTISSNVGGFGGGFLSTLDGLEAGVIHFAGVGSDLECTQSSIGSQTYLKKRTLLSAIAQLQSAFGLLLSSSIADHIVLNSEQQTLTENVPGGGTSGSNPTFKQTTDILANTIGSIITRMNSSSLDDADQALQDASQFAPLLQGMVDTIFGLIPVDSINQSHQEVVITVVNGIFKALLVKSLTKHHKFAAIKHQQHTLQSLQEYTTIISEEVSMISDLIDQLVSILVNTYSLQQVSAKSLPGLYAPSLSAQDIHHLERRLPDDLALQLTPSLMVLLEVIISFWKDLKLCGDLSKNVLSSEHGHSNRLQARELGLMCKNLESGMHNALATLQYAHAQICGLLRLEYAGIERYSREYLVRESSTTTHVDGSSSTLVVESGKTGNPITLVSNYSPSHGGSRISVLFTYLERYDLVSALKYCHSFIHTDTQGTRPGTTVSTSHTATEDRKSVTEKQRHMSNTHHKSHSVVPTPSTTSTTRSSPLILSQSKSWTSHSDSSGGGYAVSFARNATFTVNKKGRKVVACLAQLMAAYFTNKKLLVSSPGSNQPSKMVERFLELSRNKLARAIKEQRLSEVWTVDHTLELLLLSDMWTQACEFVVELGDWRKGVLLAGAYLCHSRQLSDEKRDRFVENELCKRATELAMKDIFKLLDLRSTLDLDRGISMEINQSICSTLMICSLSHLDCVITSTVGVLLKRLRVLCRSLSLEVPSCVYLPAPPLYCPQPSVTKEELIQAPKEYDLRCKISTLVNNLVLILHSSNCLHPSARWYVTKLQQSVTSVQGEATELLRLPGKVVTSQLPLVAPESAVKFKDDPSELSPAVHTLLVLFRELCSLMWFLHVRDKASLHLRKLQPKIHKPQTQPEDVCQAATWCARLLPFKDFLSKDGGVTYSDCVQDVVLSTLMELPADHFLAELLAYCFPESVFDASYLEAKMKRLLSRLRSSHDPSQTSSSSSSKHQQHTPLSVHYQTRSQLVLSQRGDTFDPENCGRFFSFVNTSSDTAVNEVIDEACLKVGSFSFEWDTEYYNFLDTFLSVILPDDIHYLPSTNTSILDSPHLSVVPYLSEYTDKETDLELMDTGSKAPNWQKILSLLDAFTRWSQASTPQLTMQQELTKRTKNDQRRTKGAKNDQEMSTMPSAPVMRVNVSMSFVVNCLKQREGGLKEKQTIQTRGKDQRTLDPSKHNTASPSTASVVRQPSLLHAASPPATAPRKSVTPSGEESRSLNMEDLNQTPRHSQTSRPSVKTPADEVDLALQTGSHEEPLPLLKVPEGVLKGHLPPEVGRSLLASSRITYSADDDNDDTSALDVVLTESYSSSTGEAPSAFTFSIGEVVKKTGDATMMTVELDTLSSISDQLQIPHITQEHHNHQHSQHKGQSSQKKGSEGKKGHKDTKEGSSKAREQDGPVDQKRGGGGDDRCNGGSGGGMGDGNEDSESNHSGSKSGSETEREEDDDDSSTFVVTSTTLSEVSQVPSEGVGSHDTTIQAEEEMNIEVTDKVKVASGSLKEGVMDAKGLNQKKMKGQTIVTDVPQATQQESKDSIRDIVRTEMAKVLQHQQRQLLSILTEKSAGGQQTVAPTRKTVQPLPITDLEVSPEALVPVDTQPRLQPSSPQGSSEESVAPVLNVEDLVSPTDTAVTDQLSHFTVSGSPGQPQHVNQQLTTQQPQLHHSKQLFSHKFDPTTSKATPHPTIFSGAGPSSTQTNNPSRVNNFTLLHIDDLYEPASTPSSGGGGGVAKQPLSLEKQFPGLARALNEFNKTVTARPVVNVGPSLMSGQNGRVGGNNEIKGMPLLQLPKEEDTLPGIVQPLMQVELPAQQKSMATSAAIPLLTIPPEMMANPPPSFHRPHTYHPSHPHPSHSPPHTHKPPPSQFHQPPTHGPLVPEDIKLPHIPIQPFVPKLIPPDVIWPNTTTGANQNPPKQQVDPPFLLKLDDPLTKMKENGMKLLQLPKEYQIQEPSAQLLKIDPSQLGRRHFHGHAKSSKQRNKRNKPQFDSTTSSFEVSSDGYTRGAAVAFEDDDYGKVLRGGKKDKVKKNKKKSKHGRHVTWKRESPSPTFKSALAGTQMIMPEHSTSISTLEESENSTSVSHHQSSQKQSPEAANATSVGAHAQENVETPSKPVSNAGVIQPLSGIVHPDTVPYKSLELRRLELNTSSPSFTSSPLKSHDSHLVSSDIANPSESTLSTSVSASTQTVMEDHEKNTVTKDFTSHVDKETRTPGTCSVGFEATKTVAKIRTTSSDVGVQVDTPLPAESAVLSSPGHVPSSVDEGTQVETPQELSLGSTGSTYVVETVNVDQQTVGSGEEDVCGTGIETGHVSDSGSSTPIASQSHPVYSPLPDHVIVEPESDLSESPIPIPKDFVGFNATPPPPLYFSASDEEGVVTPITADDYREKGSDLVKVDVFEQLQLLEEQLNAIESTARTVEGEFKATNQILQTIDQLQTVSETSGHHHHHNDDGNDSVPLEDVNHFISTSTPRDRTRDTVNTRLTPLDSVDAGLKPVDTQSMRVDRRTNPSTHTNQIQPLVDSLIKVTKTSKPVKPPTKQAPLATKKKTQELPRKFEASKTSPDDLQAGQATTRTGTPNKRGPGKTQPGKQQHVSFEDPHQQQQQQQQWGKTGGGDLQQVRNLKMSGQNKPSIADKERVREWMIAKRQERLAEFVNERKRLQEKEKHPFEPPPPSTRSNHGSKDQVKSVKRDREKKIVAKRIDEAYSLMNDLLSSKPLSKQSSSSLHPSSTSSESLPVSQTKSKANRKQPPLKNTFTKHTHESSAHLPPKGTAHGANSRRQKVTKDTRKRAVKDGGGGLDSLLKKSSSDSNLFRHSVSDAMESSSTGGGKYGSTTRLSGTYTKALGSPKRENRMRKISSVDGLTEDEQDRIATILASTDYDARSISSGSVYSNIDWEEVDRILDT